MSRTLLTSALVTTSQSYLTTTDDTAVFANGDITITLYPANSQPGQLVFIKNIGTGNVIVQSSSRELIDDATSLTLTENQYLTVINTNTQWWILYAPANLTVPVTAGRIGTVEAGFPLPTQISPVITWSNPANLTYGAVLSGTQLNAVADVAGAFTYDPPAGTIMTVGPNQALTATFVPTDNVYYGTVTARVYVNVGLLPSAGRVGYSEMQVPEAPIAAVVIARFAGTGTDTSTGDGGSALTATLRSARGLAVDSVGNVLFSDQYAKVIRKVNITTGVISHVAGDGTSTYVEGASAASTGLGSMRSIAVDSADNIYIAAYGITDITTAILKINASSGLVTRYAGAPISEGVTHANLGDGADALHAYLNSIYDVAVDGSDNVYICDFGDHRIRKVTAATGIISTVAGTTGGFSGDGAAATSAKLNGPVSVDVDDNGHLYISDANNYRIRKVDAGTGNISTIAGTGSSVLSGDGGLATSAGVEDLWGIEVDSADNIYFVESSSCCVRRIDALTGIVDKFAGTGTWGYSGDDGDPLLAEIGSVETGLSINADGTIVYINDAENCRIRRIGPAL